MVGLGDFLCSLQHFIISVSVSFDDSLYSGSQHEPPLTKTSSVLSGMFLLGDSGGVVNSLDFCPASLKSLGWFYFRCVLSLQWKAVTVNLRILHCQR